MTTRLRGIPLAVALLALASATPARAQVLLGATYSWSLPSGDLESFVGNNSWLGLSLEGRKFIGTHTSVGLSLGWNEFYERTDEPLSVGNATITGDQYRSVNAFPLLVTGHIYSKAGETMQMYLGLGAGVYYIREQMDVGTYTIEKTSWVFGVAPEAGVRINSKSDMQFAVFGRYHYPVEAGSFLPDDPASMQYLSVGLMVLYKK